MQSSLQVTSKLPDVGTNIFTVIGELSAQHQALNLSQGAPNFACDSGLIDLTHQAMRENHNQYAPMAGVLALREAMAQKIHTLYQASYDPQEEVTIVGSASEGLYAAISALVHPGDEVIIIEPAFDSYAPVIRLQQAHPIAIRLHAPDFLIPWDEIQSAITAKTRMIVLNTPHNPTGTILQQADIDALIRITENTQILILSDEVYEHVVFDGQVHHSMSRHPKLAERSIVVTSFGKTYHITGWRVGCVVAPKDIMAEIRKTHQFIMFAADTPMQIALAQWMSNPQHYLGLSSFYQKKRDLLTQELSNSRFTLLPSDGSFFMLASYEKISDLSENDFVQKLIKEQKVATIPLSAFYHPEKNQQIIRLSFAKQDETLIEGARRLCQL